MNVHPVQCYWRLGYFKQNVALQADALENKALQQAHLEGGEEGEGGDPLTPHTGLNRSALPTCSACGSNLPAGRYQDPLVDSYKV